MSAAELPSTPHSRRPALAGFVLAAGLALLPLALPASPWALVATLSALAFALVGAAFALSHRPEQRWWSTLRHRFPAVLLLVLLAAGAVLLLTGWPAWALWRSGSLLAVLGLSAAIALAGVGLARFWPAPGLPLIDAARCGGSLGLVRRSLREAARLVASDPSPSRAVLAALAWLLLLGGALLLGLGAAELGAQVRLGLTLGWGLLGLPFLSFVLLALVEPARLGSAQTPIPQLPPVPLREPTPPLAMTPAQSEDPDARLYAAARAGRTDQALQLLDAGADPHALPAAGDRDQRSLPMLAAVLGDTRLLRALIIRGVDLNRVHAGLTPLLAATRDSLRGRPDAVMTLLANGADPRSADAEGRTPLHFAALTGEPDVAALLLDAGAPLEALNRDGYSALGVACSAGNWRLARFLLERKARPEPEGGQPALIAAAGGDDDPAGAQLLLRHKAKPNARGRLGRTALMNACLAGNSQIVECLLGAGADVDASDDNGVTALHEAARAGANGVLQLLAARHPDPSRTDIHGRNALLVACRSSSANADTVGRLLEIGVDATQPGSDGRTALDCALDAGRWPLVAVLDPQRPLPASLVDELPSCSPDAECDGPVAGESAAAVGEPAPLAERIRQVCSAGDIPELDRLLRQAGSGQIDLLLALFDDADPNEPAAQRGSLAAALARIASPERLTGLIDRALADADLTTLAALLDQGHPVVGRGTLAAWLGGCLRSGRAEATGQAMALRLLGQGADPFGGDAGLPLLLAVRLGWTALADALLERGVDPDAPDRLGRTALQLASSQRDPVLVRRLLCFGAQPDRRSCSGDSALGLALASGDHGLAGWLDWRGWRLPRRRLRVDDLINAAAIGDAAAVDRLLQMGLPIDGRDAQGATALLRACGGGHAAVVDRLLQAGADPLLAAHSGATCLSAAISRRQPAIVQRLLAAGVPVDQPLPGGITPLMVAAALGWPDLVRQLLEAGAEAGRVDQHGNSALHALAQWGALCTDRGRATALWQALLGAAADPDSRNDEGLTPLLLLLGARAELDCMQDEDIIAAQLELLLARRLDLEARDGRGFTPLHLAALHGQLRAVRRLLVAGADRDARDQLNRSAREVAVMRGFVDIAAELEVREAPAPTLARFLREPR